MSLSDNTELISFSWETVYSEIQKNNQLLPLEKTKAAVYFLFHALKENEIHRNNAAKSVATILQIV